MTEDTIKFYANLMEKIYKNEKYPELQAYWSSDTVRNHYTFRQKHTDNLTQWHSDKNGLIITSKVITPLLKFTVEVLRKRLSELNEKQKKLKEFNSIMAIVRKQELITGFILQVEKNELQEEIIKRMSSSFYLDVDKQMINISKNKKKKTNKTKTIIIKGKK
jgi:hypothetical protein